MEKARKIMILNDIPCGKESENLIVNSIHKLVKCPKGKSKLSGVWVQGMTVPVRLLGGEYQYVDHE